MLDTRNASFWATHAGAELDLLATAAGNDNCRSVYDRRFIP